MSKLSASNLVRAINNLDRNNIYNYINSKTKGYIKIVHVQLPEGPIRIKRWNPTGRGSKNEAQARIESISTEMIWRIANALAPNQPINFDRILGASYNTRSVLESLLAYTSEFHFCYPGRIELIRGEPRVKPGHKHLMWTPNNTHELGIISKLDTDIVINEVPSTDAIYDSLTVTSSSGINDISALELEKKRTHALMQIALYNIGKQLDYRTWIAQNDKGIIYQNKRIAEYEGVIPSLNDEPLLKAHADAIKAALLIDCIWFKNGKLMPAVMEVEHSTGVRSGLSRMKNFQDLFPPFPTRYVIVAPDEDRARVVQEANKEQFRSLDTKFFPYSAVNELYSLCKRRNIKGISQEFLDSFMEPVLN